MIICPNCNTEQEAMKFCGNCGARLPEPKKNCPQCNTEWPNEQKFCGECGFNFLDNNKNFQKSAISLGNDNMIAGDFIGKKEDYHIAGSATFVKNEDETKVNKKQLEKLAQEKFGNLAGIAQQYLFYWKREA